MTFKIERWQRGPVTVVSINGRIESDEIGELEQFLGPRDGFHRLVLDLKETRLVDHGIVKFLAQCERHGMTIENCPTYIQKWIEKELGE